MPVTGVQTCALPISTVQKTVPVIVYWNAQKVKAMLAADVLSQVDLGDTTNVSTDLSLPKVASGKLWAQITWTSSDPSVISVSSENQGTADTLFAPYVGKVKCGETPKDVTLTAKVVFQRTAMGPCTHVPEKSGTHRYVSVGNPSVS